MHSTRGIVACSQPLAAKCGIEILEKGGNAAVSFPGQGISDVVADLIVLCHRTLLLLWVCTCLPICPL